MSVPTGYNYEKLDLPYDSHLSRGSSVDSPESGYAGSSDKPNSLSQSTEGDSDVTSGREFSDIWIQSWIKSRAYRPKSAGFLIEGKRGYIECMQLYVGSGGIVGGKIDIPNKTTAASFHVDASGNMWIGSTKFNSAPFTVTNTGDVVMNSATGNLATATGRGARVEISKDDNRLTVYDDFNTPILIAGGTGNDTALALYPQSYGGYNAIYIESYSQNAAAIDIRNHGTTGGHYGIGITSSAGAGLYVIQQSDTSAIYAENALLTGGVDGVITAKSLTGSTDPAVLAYSEGTGARSHAVYAEVAAASGATSTPFYGIQNTATSTNYYRQQTMNSAGISDVTIWTANGVSPGGVLSGEIGDLCASTNGILYVCQGGTTWTQAGSGGGDVFSFNYVFNSALVEPPASGQIRFNNTTPSSATRVFIHETNSAGVDLSSFLNEINADAILYVYDVATPTTFHIFSVTSNTDDGSYRDFAVTYLGGNGIIASGDTTGLSFYNKGPTGPAGGSPELILQAGGGSPSLTSGANTPIQIEYGTNDINTWVMDFDDTGSAEYAEWNGVMPANWDGGTVTAKFYWTANSTSTNSVVWGLAARSYADGDNIDQAYGTAASATDANTSTANQLHISSVTSAITVGGAPAAGQAIQFRVYRDSSDGFDTLAATARLMAVRVLYGTV